MLCLLVAVAAASVASGRPFAKARYVGADQIEAGRLVAARFCGECHAVSPVTVSPLPDALPMDQLYRRFPVDRMGEAIELGMMKDHPRMPDFDMGDDERHALSDFLSSFDPKEHPAPRKRPRPSPSAA